MSKIATDQQANGQHENSRKNLAKGFERHVLTKEDQAKGGRQFGINYRKRKAMKEQAELMLSLTFNIKDKNGKDLVDRLKAMRSTRRPDR